MLAGTQNRISSAQPSPAQANARHVEKLGASKRHSWMVGQTLKGVVEPSDLPKGSLCISDGSHQSFQTGGILA